MSKTANSSWETTGKPIVVLTVISLIVSLLLALVNGMTAPVIKENTRRTTLAKPSGRLCRRAALRFGCQRAGRSDRLPDSAG